MAYPMKKHGNKKDGRKPGFLYSLKITDNRGVKHFTSGRTENLKRRIGNYKTFHGTNSIIETLICKKFRRNYQHLEDDLMCKFGDKIPRILDAKGKLRNVKEYWPLSESDKIVEWINALPN